MGKNKKKKSRHSLAYLVVMLVVVAAAAGAWYVFGNTNEASVVQRDSSGSVITPQPGLQEAPAKKGVLKTLTAEQFRDLYNNFAWPNTQRIDSGQPLTDNPEADAHIRKVAEARGYRLRSAPVSKTFVSVDTDMVLQQRAAEDWVKLKDAAAQEGIRLSLTDGYRSAEDQREIFLGRMQAAGIQISRIASGTEDAKLNQLMSVTAPPSYSRHHSGYTVDIACDNQPGGMFENSVCFEWISKDNYKQAKTYGWIPSYPEGAEDQGPEPEAWEYVWVGKDALTD